MSKEIGSDSRPDLLEWVGDRRQAFLELAEDWRGRLADERAEAGGQRVAAVFSQVAEQRPLTPSVDALWPARGRCLFRTLAAEE